MTSILHMPEQGEIIERELAARLGSSKLVDVLFALNRAAVAWGHGGGELLSPLPGVRPPDTAFQWLIAEAARLAIWFCPPSSTSSGVYVNWTPFGSDVDVAWLLHKSLAAQDMIHLGTAGRTKRLSTATARELVPWLLGRQRIVQRRSNLRVGHALLMYETAAVALAGADTTFQISVYRDALNRALGTQLRSFLLALAQLEGKAESAEPYISTMTTLPKPSAVDHYAGTDFLPMTGGGILSSAAGSAIHTLSADPKSAIAWSLETSKDTDVQGFRQYMAAPNPLLRFPLIRVYSDHSDYVLAPAPGLISEWLYEQLANLVHDQCIPAGFERRHFFALFEKYVGVISQLATPGPAQWLKEAELKDGLPSGTSVVDFAYMLADGVVLVDAKRNYVAPGTLYRSEAQDSANLIKSWTEALKQAGSFWRAASAGKATRLRECSRKMPVLVVVSHGDVAATVRGEAEKEIRRLVYAAIPDDLPRVASVMVSIGTWECIVSEWSTRDPAWLWEKLWSAARTEHSAALEEIPSQTTGPLWHAVAQLVLSASDEVGSGTDPHNSG